MSVTIKDIAKSAGVSTATVCRVLSNKGFVKNDTRELVRKIIDEHKYTYTPQDRDPNKPKAIRLKYQNFGMIWSASQKGMISTTAQEIIQGLSQAVSNLGGTLNVEFITRNDEISNILEKRKIDGLFLNGSRIFSEKIKDLPVVWLLQAGAHDYGDRVQPDHFQVGVTSAQYFQQKGCKNLCCISCSDYHSPYAYWKTREHGFCNTATAAQIHCDIIRLDYDDNINNPMDQQRQAAVDAVNQIKKLKHKPDGIFVANTLGLPIHAELMANGIVPFRDVELIAGDKEVCNGYCSPEPIKIDAGIKNIGDIAVKAMMLRLQNPEMSQLTYMLKPSLIIP